MDIKKLREQADLTQEELAEKTGIPRNRIAKWEQGKGKPKAEDSLTMTNFFSEFVPTENGKNKKHLLEEDQAPYHTFLKIKSNYVQRFTSLH